MKKILVASTNEGVLKTVRAACKNMQIILMLFFYRQLMKL